MSGDTTHVKGLSQLNDFMQQLPAKVERNVLRGALRAGATQAVLPEVKIQLASSGHVKTGLLIAGLKVGGGAKGGRVFASVKLTGKHAFVGRWLEFTGAAAHMIKAKKGGFLSFLGIFAKSIDHPGFIAKPFFRPALAASASKAVVAAAEYMKKRLATKEGLNTSDINIEAEA